MKYQIQLSFDTKEQRNAWVNLIRTCMARMEEISMELDEE
ncbi:unnamed protein product [marine sediment metagenome]|uniref:PH domain-containing protein n=1 Tax=marine sediment metagenome TaxID=412755 RepID=X1HMT3_9ZZZZ